MNILIAEDDTPSRLMLQSLLVKWGYSVTSAKDGDEAWNYLCEPGHPHLLILDWKMPGIEGPELVKRLREREPEKPYYAIIITSRSNKDSASSALNSGADDFIGKPFDNDELRARVAVGYRMNCLQNALYEHIQDLSQALNRVKRLEGIIPICMYCKKIRDDQNSWNQLEQYISDHSEAMFSHGICPDCIEKQTTIIQQL
ncbi:MAG: response regulator [Desulfuromonadaceae bacterium]|nr:response regulator [Desulfuromonadaceae bacterium]MDD5104391.1 response regulator [Desulfuromonadaceae bacterium]